MANGVRLELLDENGALWGRLGWKDGILYVFDAWDKLLATAPFMEAELAALLDVPTPAEGVTRE